MKFLYLDFRLQYALSMYSVSTVGRGGGVQKAQNEPLRPNCEPSEMPPPPLHSGTHEIISDRIFTWFFQSLVLCYEFSTFKLQNLYSVFQYWDAMF